MLNEVTLIGRFGKNLKIVAFGDNESCGLFSVATYYYTKNAQGEKVEKTEWHNVACYKGHVDLMRKYAHLNSHICIKGRLRNRTWTDDRTGQERHVTEVVAEQIYFIGRTQDNNQSGDMPNL